MAIIVLAAFGVAIAARVLTTQAPLQHRETGGLGTASVQSLGGLRSVPLIALWQRADAARQHGEWYEQLAIFDALQELAPNNPGVPYYQARLEAVTAANDQPTRADAWAWVERGLERLRKARTIPNGRAQAEEGIWDVGYNVSKRFPMEFALWVMRDERGPGATPLTAMPELTPEVEAFLEKTGLWLGYRETAEYAALGDATRMLIDKADEIRWNTLARIGIKGLEYLRGLTSSFAFKGAMAIMYASAFLPDGHPRIKTLKGQVRDIIDTESKRLRGLGATDIAISFDSQCKSLFGAWLGN